MKFKPIVILVTCVVTLGLMLGTSTAQAATVIFDPGNPFQATGIRNLEIDGILYNVAFTSGTGAEQFYGTFPGTFDFDTTEASEEAIDEVNRELNMAGATGVGAAGSAAVPFYWVGIGSDLEVDPIIQAVFILEALYGEVTQEGLSAWVTPQSPKPELYNFATGVWAKFTEAPTTGTQVIFEGNNATGILNLDVRGKLYNVDFLYESAFDIYGSTPVFDLQGKQLKAARRAVRSALNSEPAVTTVGSVEAGFYLIGIRTKGEFVSVKEDYYRAFPGSWVRGADKSTTTLDSIFTYAVFTELE